MSVEIHLLLTELKTRLSQLDLQLMKNKIDYDEAQKIIIQIQKASLHIKNLMRILHDLGEIHK